MTHKRYDVIFLLSRVMLALVFLLKSYQLAHSVEGTQAYMALQGVPPGLFYPALLLQVVAGTGLLLGLFTRVASLALCAFCFITAFFFHAELSHPLETDLLLGNLGMAAGLLLLFALGGGGLSLDAKLAKQHLPKENERT